MRSTLTLLPLHTRPVQRAVRCNAASCPIRTGLDVRSERPRSLQVTWESLVYSDGSIYQGLAQQGKAQGRGGLLYANGDSYVPLCLHVLVAVLTRLARWAVAVSQ